MGSDLSGRKLGPFQLEGLLGKGSMGSVYRATHRKTGKPAAIKVLSGAEEKTESNFFARFEREVKLLSQFHHPNIVRIYGHSEVDGIHFYAMELVEGKSLAVILEDCGKLSFLQTIRCGVQICEALQEMHAVGVIHRDLKPANLMISSDQKVKLTDFGIAKDLSAMNDTQLTAADRTVGTIGFMSPEQLAGEDLTRKSDLYSLGLVLYRMLLGRLPFIGETVFEYMEQRMRGTYPLPSLLDRKIPFEFDDIIRKLLAQDPEDRPMDAFVVMECLLEIEKKAEAGTLTKVRVREATRESTAESGGLFGTMLQTVTGVLPVGAGKGRAKSKPKEKRERTPFFESALFLVVSLAALIGFGLYMFWPPSPEELFAQGKALMQKESLSEWQEAIEKYFEPILEKDPQSPYRKEIEEFRAKFSERTAINKARGRVKIALIRSMARSDASQAERKFIEAKKLEDTDLDTAIEKYKAIVSGFKDDPQEHIWVYLAEERIQDPVLFEKDQQRLREMRETVEKMLERAKNHQQKGNNREAHAIYASIIELYQEEEEVSDLVEQAHQAIEEAPE